MRGDQADTPTIIRSEKGEDLRMRTKKDSARPRGVLLLTILLLAAVSCGWEVSAQISSTGRTESGVPNYSFPTEAGTVVLEIKATDGSLGRTSTLRLFGDGRVILDKHHHALTRPEAHYEYTATPAEVEALLNTVVDGRLQEFDQTRITSEQLAITGGSTPVVADGIIVVVQIVLEDLQSDPPIQIARLLRVVDPVRVAGLFPQIEELGAVADLHAFLTQSLSQAPERR